ncbi:hypothetical protein H6F70_22750 [Coleofasciculus sp. FACHB-T130]|nr:hypothetical protein [Coleofasciculus sp. FACHB-T130]
MCQKNLAVCWIACLACRATPDPEDNCPVNGLRIDKEEGDRIPTTRT